MNGQSHEKITTNDLRAITQAPTVEEPLVPEGEFPPELTRSSRPVWTKPIPKLALIGLLLIPVFGFAALFLAGGGRFKQAQKNPSQPPLPETASQPETVPEELTRLREENGKLKANAAIGDQNNLQDRSAKNGKPNQKSPRIPGRATANATNSPKSETPPSQIVRQASPPKLVSAPVSLATSGYTPVVRPTAIKAKPNDQIDDPMQQWQQLARLGSYGSSTSERSSDSEWSNASRSLSNSSGDQPLSTQTEDSASSESIPTARIAPTSAVQADTEMMEVARISDQPNPEQPELRIDQNRQVQADQTVLKATIAETRPEISRSATQSLATEPPILKDAEAAILQEKIRQHSLIAGENTPGILATPVALDDLRSPNATRKAKSDQFTIVLAQPLKDSTGQIAMPTGAHLLVQVDRFSKTGQVQLSATTAVWSENGLKKELTLPTGAIQVRGENGKPLIAKQLEDRGKEIAAMDVGQFLLGAARRSAQLFTRSNSQIQTGNGTTVVTENNPAPNLLAGALEGGTDTVLSSVQERNKQAIKDMEQRPNSRFIASGSPVQVFVNQSMQLPN